MPIVIRDFIEDFSVEKRTRILDFGSSNDERYLPGLHLFDCFEIALRQKYGRIHTCINTCISGNTSSDLLGRFKDDAAFYKTQLVFITIGGNDCNPEKKLDLAEFRENIKELHHRFSAINCGVIFQTYYSPDPDECEAERLNNFYEYTDVIREVAAETDSELIDNLMRNGFHVKPNGNKVTGVDIARRLGIDFSESELNGWEEALTLQKSDG